MEGMEFWAIATTIDETISRIRSATESSTTRKIASPVEPVADIARLKLQRRAMAPYPAAGVEIFGCGFIITKSQQALLRLRFAQGLTTGGYGVNLLLGSPDHLSRQRGVL
jgi:hypothetical protein